MSNPRIVIVIEGGCIEDVYAENKVDVLIIDKDCEGSDDYSSFKIKASGIKDEFDADTHQPQEVVSPEVVKQLFDQVS